MSPYRAVPEEPPRYEHGTWTKVRRRLLIWWNGRWKDRWARCAHCRQGIVKVSSTYRASGGPGSRAVDYVLEEWIEFSCGHTLRTHRQAQVAESIMLRAALKK